MILKVLRNQVVPADSVLLISSDFNTNKTFVETKNLDGETNLKQKQIIHTHNLPTEETVDRYLEELWGNQFQHSDETPHFFIFQG